MNTSRYTKHGLILMALFACQSVSLATPVDLTDTPLPVQSAVAPNILFMLDTSGSMSNIVPDTPYDPNVTYLTSCPVANTFPGGVSAPAIPVGAHYRTEIDSSGNVTINLSPSYSTPTTFGTGNSQGCFAPTLRYSVALKKSGDYTAYEGNYLNWYFCTGPVGNCNSAATFPANADRKLNSLTRLDIAQNSAKAIIDSLDTVRTGLSHYSSVSGEGGELTVPMALNTAAQKNTVKTAIDGYTASGSTPLAETLSGIGAYFALVTSGTALDLTLHPGQSNQSTAAASDVFSGHGSMLRNGIAGTPTPTIAAPVQYACQKNFAVLMTDGRPTNDRSLSTYLCDYMGIAGGCGANFSYGQKLGTNASGNGTGTDAGYHVNGTNKQLHIGDPHFYETAGSDYLDDVASALYEMDLRPDLTKTGTQKNNVTTYMIGFADLSSRQDALMQETAAAGGGLFATASNSAELVAAFQQATDDILAKDGSAAAVAVANAHVTNTDNASYATSYNSGVWSGDLIAYPINTITGVPNIQTPIWNTGCDFPLAYVEVGNAAKGVLGCSAQVQLDLRTSANRKIFTTNDSACTTNCGIPFRPTTAAGAVGVDKVSAVQQTLLNTPTKIDGASVIDYLRGERSGEVAQTYRLRKHLLGDMVNAEPLVVREPDRNYLDLNYDTFKANNDNRARIIFQVSNDGMAHAFDSLTGAELWAYVPNMLISDAKDPNSATTSLLNTRSRKSAFNHYFLLDGTPISGDIDFANSGITGVTTTDWRTIIVGGMGKGGRGYYALDVTTTIAATEATAASKALWEFPRSITSVAQRNSAKLNMGYSYGKPVIVKTVAKGWVVLIPSGYNNGTGTGTNGTGGDGLGHLYVVNAKTGDLIADLVTPACNASPATNPCGLANINAYIENKDKDNTAELAYGGDLYGNLWRFDLRGATVASWSVSKMATLRSGATNGSPVQPITTVPEVSKILIGGVSKYFVYVGTGLFLGKTDLPCPPSPATCPWVAPNAQSTMIQTMYGLLETRTAGALPDPLLPTLVEQTFTTTGNVRNMSTNPVDYTTKNGWYINFPVGERMVTDAGIASGTLVFTSSIPRTEPCIPGGSSWLYAIDYQTGGAITFSGPNGTTVKAPAGTFLGDALASRPVLIQLPDGKVMALIRLSDTTTVIKEVPTPVNPAASKRVSWRELIDN